MSLSNAKVGDKLLIEARSSKYIDEVVAITKAGNIKTKKYGIFNPRGYARGDSWVVCHAKVATPEDIAVVARNNKIGYLSNFKEWNKLTSLELDYVIAVIKSACVKVVE